MILIDTHAHLTYSHITEEKFLELNNNWQKNNVKIVFTTGFNLDSSKKCLELASRYDNIYAIIGVHPSDISELSEQTINWLKQNASHKKVVAIGEIGLDYHYEGIHKQEQINGFISQLTLAHEVGLPVVIHTRDASCDLITTLKQHKHLLQNGGVVHCFSESYEFYKELEDLGLLISVGGVITFKNSTDLQETLKQIPLANIMLETDAPYLTPMPFRGKVQNDSQFLPLIAQKLADIKQTTLQVVAEVTTNNAYNLFKKVIKE